VNRRGWLARVAALAAASAWPAASRSQAQREIVDAAGRKVRVPARSTRVFASGPPASILVFAVAPDTLLGWTTPFRPAERPFVPAKYADLPVTGRLTGRGNTANVELVIASRPDLIVDYGAVNDTYASLADRVQQQTGIPYLLLDGTFDNVANAIRTVGALTGEDAGADALARYARDTVDDVTRRVASVPTGKRPRLYYGRGPRGLDTGLAGSINMEVIDRLGATNVAASMGRGGLVQVSLEQVLAWDPEVIVTTDPTFFASVRRDPLWAPVAAVKARRIHLAPAEPFGWIDFPPSINRLVGMRWLGRILYPDVFPEDLRPAVREYYTRFYHQAPGEPQLDALIATAERVPPA
jgi:iron complex transport system substrate-binding protein